MAATRGRARSPRAAPARGGCRRRRAASRARWRRTGTSEVSVPRPTTSRWMPYSSTRRSCVPPTWTTSQRAGVQALRQPARCQVDVAIEAADGRELDEAGAEAHVVELDRARERLVGERACGALRAAVERRVAARGDLARPGDAQGALGGRERRQRVAQREVLGDGAASGDARQERDRDRHARAHEQRAPGARAQAPARHREHGGRASPARAAVRAGSAVRGGGGLVHVGRAPKDTVDAPCLRFRRRRRRSASRWDARDRSER